jgi:hypothetical protein
MSKSIVIPVLALVLGVGLNNAACAATLGDVAAAMAAPSGSAQPTNDWTSFAKLKGVKWKGNAPAKGGNTYYWNGATMIDGLGSGEISMSGSKTAVMMANATVYKLVDRNKLPQLLAEQFPKDAKLDVVRGACPDERASASRIYRVTLPGRKPLHLHVQMVVQDRGGSFTSFEMEPQRNKDWIC